MSRRQRKRVRDVLRERRVRLRRNRFGHEPFADFDPPDGYTMKECVSCRAVVFNDLDEPYCVPCWWSRLLGSGLAWA
jgi:hypothetical protein